MLDDVAFTAVFLVASLALWFLIRRFVKNRAVAIVLTVPIALVLSGYVVLEITRSRSFQFFGHLVTAQPTVDKLVALTLDDGPTAEFTPQILETLRQHDVKATFFLIGGDIAQAPEAARMIAAAGHEIGNHSYSHRRMVFKTGPWIREEIERTDVLIRASGYQGTIHFRSPYGKRFVSLPRYLAQTNRQNVFFDVEPESDPAIDANAELLVRHVLEETRPGSIILLHPMYAERGRTRSALPAIIAGLKERGFRFVTVTELIAARD